ncbi:thioredoxin family protein [Mariniphaga sp.]|uniref:thioredoxin family protein n=1 Tax=Mariniphaga sp. TaxID=1954475 RepID=UPI0035625327
MEREIKIFCPKRKCGKCKRLVSRVEEALAISGLPLKIEIVDSLDQMIKYPTWILPTLVINGKVAARGYVPSVKMIVSKLTENKSIL